MGTLNGGKLCWKMTLGLCPLPPPGGAFTVQCFCHPRSDTCFLIVILQHDKCPAHWLPASHHLPADSASQLDFVQGRAWWDSLFPCPLSHKSHIIQKFHSSPVSEWGRGCDPHPEKAGVSDWGERAELSGWAAWGLLTLSQSLKWGGGEYFFSLNINFQLSQKSTQLSSRKSTYDCLLMDLNTSNLFSPTLLGISPCLGISWYPHFPSLLLL